MPRVLNKRQDEIHADAVYVGRPTKYGNPWKAGRDGTREQVVARYERWLLDDPALVQQAQQELRGKDLVCWCTPLLCHADVLLGIANAPVEYPWASPIAAIDTI